MLVPERSLSYFCIINPRSGGGRGHVVAQQLRELFASGGLPGCVVEFDPLRLGEHIASACGYDGLLVGGGDGTVAAVLAVLVDVVGAPNVGILPLGTANDLARQYAITLELANKSVGEMLAYYCTTTTQQLQLWRCCELSGKSYVFSNYISFGFDAAVVDSFSKWRNLSFIRPVCRSKFANRVLYGLAALRHSLNFIDCGRFKIIVDGNAVSLGRKGVRSVLITNLNCIMGFGESQTVGRADDQLLEVVEVSSLFDYLVMALRGALSARYLPAEKVRAVGSHIDVVSSVTFLQIDGESVSVSEDARYHIEPFGVVNLLAPKRRLI